MDYPDPKLLEALKRWLNANVKQYPTPEVVTLSDFEIDFEYLTGTYKVTLDDMSLDDEFSFEIGGNGAPNVFLPMFHSPLGTPASFAAVELTTETENAIQMALAHLLPKLRPFGLNRGTGEHTDITTPVEDRVLEPKKLATLLQSTGLKTYRLKIKVLPGEIIFE